MYKLIYYRNGEEEQTFIDPNGERSVMSIALDVIGDMVGHTDTSFAIYDANDNLVFDDEDVND